MNNTNVFKNIKLLIYILFRKVIEGLKWQCLFISTPHHRIKHFNINEWLINHYVEWAFHIWKKNHRHLCFTYLSHCGAVTLMILIQNDGLHFAKFNAISSIFLFSTILISWDVNLCVAPVFRVHVARSISYSIFSKHCLLLSYYVHIKQVSPHHRRHNTYHITYERDSIYSTGTFEKSALSLTEKSTNNASVTPSKRNNW